MSRLHQKWLAPVMMAAILALLGVAGLHRAAADGPPSPLQGGEEPPEERPCGITFDRTLEPRVVKQGDQITVRVNYDYKCAQRSRKVNIILAVADTLGSDVNPRDGVSILNNLKRGLKDFANRVNYSNGSCIGLVVFAATAMPLMPLQCGAAARDEILKRIDNNLRLKPSGAVNGLGEAIRDATQQLPVDDKTQDNLIVVFDSGAPETGSSEERIPVPTDQACEVAKRGGVEIAAVQMAWAQGRLIAYKCITQGMWTARQSDGKDLQEVWNAAAEALLYGDKMNEATYCDYFNRQLFEFIPGSASPRDPDDDDPFSGVCWTFKAATHRPGGQSIEYSMRVKDDDPGLAGQKIELGDEARLYFNFVSGANLEYFLPNPLICIYEKGKPEFCNNFPPATPSATPDMPPTVAPTVAPTQAPPTETATGPGPTDTPGGPAPTDTPEPPTTEPPTAVPTVAPQRTIYLPALENKNP